MFNAVLVDKEEEKRKLTKRSQELKSAKGELENKAKQLTNTITVCDCNCFHQLSESLQYFF